MAAARRARKIGLYGLALAALAISPIGNLIPGDSTTHVRLELALDR